MVGDATFEEGADRPLRLLARDAQDLRIVSSLLQDAVCPIGDMKYLPTDRRFAMLVNRFRWEDVDYAERTGRAFERVQALVTFDDVLAVRSQGVGNAGQADMILSLLSIGWTAGADGTGQMVLYLAGEGAIALEVETIEVAVRDVTRPYTAPSRRKPSHD